MTAPLDTVSAGRAPAAEAPDAVERLVTAVRAYRQEQDAVATRMLAAPDPTLDRVRGTVRSALEPLIAAFDGQVRAATRAASGPDATVTPRGLDRQLVEIARQRAAAVEAVVGPVREALAAAEQKVRAQIAAVA